MRTKSRAKTTCRCGTGFFCPKHSGYNILMRAAYTNQPEQPPLFQRCGGGRRIFRKRIGND